MRALSFCQARQLAIRLDRLSTDRRQIEHVGPSIPRVPNTPVAGRRNSLNPHNQNLRLWRSENSCFWKVGYVCLNPRCLEAPHSCVGTPQSAGDPRNLSGFKGMDLVLGI